MNHEQVAELAAKVRDLWPGTKTWDNPERFHDDFADVDLAAARGTLNAARRERFAPSPSEVMVRALRPAEGWQGRPIPADCPHFNWGIMEYETEREDGKRFAVCVACLTERLADPTVLLNSVEREERARARAEDRDREEPPGSGRRDLDG